ncbi:hypothetical protein HKD37_15G043424 [Glycine soja]|nr:hypothetical protein GmHk_13G036292 [Glycine max]KAH1215052.1 hypothetical protein GmHk_13G036292 [Glycine max]
MTLFIKQLLPITDQNWAVKVWQKLQAQVDKLSDARLEEAFYQNTKALQSFQCLDANTYRRSMILKANILLAKLQFLNFKAAPLLDLLVSSTCSGIPAGTVPFGTCGRGKISHGDGDEKPPQLIQGRGRGLCSPPRKVPVPAGSRGMGTGQKIPPPRGAETGSRVRFGDGE